MKRNAIFYVHRLQLNTQGGYVCVSNKSKIMRGENWVNMLTSGWGKKIKLGSATLWLNFITIICLAVHAHSLTIQKTMIWDVAYAAGLKRLHSMKNSGII